MLNDLNLSIRFKERPFVNTAIAKAHPYDFVSDDFPDSKSIENSHYCAALLAKIKSWKLQECQEFIRHQIKGLTDPITWLNSLRMLLANQVDKDTDKFVTLNWLMKHALVVDELRDYELRQCKKDRKFDFDQVSKELEKLDSSTKKLKYLIERKTEFLQYHPIEPIPTKPTFAAQVDLEIEKIHKLEEIALRSPVPQNIAPIKLRWNGQINILADIFHQFATIRVDGKPLIDNSASSLAEFLAHNFVDKDGNPISFETLKTILRPSRFEKRPKDGRIDISDLLE
ncbi:hypothetical protein C3K47_18840 [Solitalea longa]|uniref:Uncharacterized protein n=1 Tax=Solitalea longa TaxID=2079460 RepID=A0A2S4ZWE9_9SPHI|nr:hypothetical protein [Solitalea longa]POY34694.1 hypothetical protein C3K47_18840 [Solitalea longa]